MLDSPLSSKRFSELRIKINKLHADFRLSRDIVEKEEKAKFHSQLELKRVRKAQAVIQLVAQEVQTLVHRRISTIVSKCLKMVFEDPYEFEIEFVRKRNQTEAVIYLTRDGHKLDPSDSTGDGVVDIVSFALRLACLSLRLPKGRSFIAMDEPFKNVSADLRPRVATMLELLSEELGFQFLLSTHMKSLKLGTVVELEK